MTDRYENIRKALADMDAAAEARNALAWGDAHARLAAHVAPNTIRVLLAERDALARDAARYRWLREGYLVCLPYEDHGLGPEFPCYEELDAAIDAAMQRTSGGDYE